VASAVPAWRGSLRAGAALNASVAGIGGFAVLPPVASRLSNVVEYVRTYGAQSFGSLSGSRRFYRPR
jgi:hypothetical protein